VDEPIRLGIRSGGPRAPAARARLAADRCARPVSGTDPSRVQVSPAPHDWGANVGGATATDSTGIASSCHYASAWSPMRGIDPTGSWRPFLRYHRRSANEQQRPARRRAHYGLLARPRARVAHLPQSTLRDGGTVAIQSNAVLPLEWRPEGEPGETIQLTRTPPTATPLPEGNGAGPGRCTSGPPSSRPGSPR
jgi:hypothetical protein